MYACAYRLPRVWMLPMVCAGIDDGASKVVTIDDYSPVVSVIIFVHLTDRGSLKHVAEKRGELVRCHGDSWYLLDTETLTPTFHRYNLHCPPQRRRSQQERQDYSILEQLPPDWCTAPCDSKDGVSTFRRINFPRPTSYNMRLPVA